MGGTHEFADSSHLHFIDDRLTISRDPATNKGEWRAVDNAISVLP
jgi:hypothetical protein